MVAFDCSFVQRKVRNSLRLTLNSTVYLRNSICLLVHQVTVARREQTKKSPNIENRVAFCYLIQIQKNLVRDAKKIKNTSKIIERIMNAE